METKRKIFPHKNIQQKKVYLMLVDSSRIMKVNQEKYVDN